MLLITPEKKESFSLPRQVIVLCIVISDLLISSGVLEYVWSTSSNCVNRDSFGVGLGCYVSSGTACVFLLDPVPPTKKVSNFDCYFENF